MSMNWVEARTRGLNRYIQKDEPLRHVAVVQGAMNEGGYSLGQEPTTIGSTGPVAGVLGTVWQAGRTWPALPSHLSIAHIPMAHIA